ncbi:MAG TPA: D-alanyl-D-alanine carboxypeptidase/D-alanyl-D-alanine-endopeptidase [Candidatus Marinimicrobia bacterium]|nr:D-alanyl-D-alanine carboxypeptidase/D-alanyl-D-alanine-endopeptidase [Candidatus Neomarinimicrobiota bacterium]
MKKLDMGILLILLMVLGSCGAFSESYLERPAFSKKDKLIEAIHAEFSRPEFEHALWGAIIEDLGSGEIWYERNADKVFMPASNNKIISAATALLNLGPDYRFKTIVLCNGEIQDSVLKGDLIVRGTGDPTLYEKFYSHSEAQFELWADSLKSLGIKEIAGNIIGDDNLWDDQSLGKGWAHDYLHIWYAAEIGPLQFNENYVDIYIYPPDSLSDSIRIEPNVKSSYFTIINELVIQDTGKQELKVRRARGTNDIYLQGKVTKNGSRLSYSPSITNPTLFYVTALREALKRKGISVLGNARDIDEFPPQLFAMSDTLILHHSAPLSEIIKVMMKRSQNLYAETMVYIQGLELKGFGAFDSGRMVIEESLESMGIPKGTYILADGSGLTRYNYVTPRQLLTINKYMSQHEYWDIWYEAQSIAGVDGTLRNRMKGTAAAGNVRAKTGTISNVRGLSGYVHSADGRLLAFSFLVNGNLLGSKETEKITDRVLEMLAEYSG